MSQPTDPSAGTSDDYVGPAPRPDPWTTKEPHEGMRDNHQARVISLAPDVCLTPCGSGSVPIPYPVLDYGDHMANYVDSVRFTKQRAMVLRSNTTHVHGDEAGKDGGIKSGTYKGITEPIGHAPRVYAGKSQVIRDGDRHWMNYCNTIGEANFKRDLATYDPPPDDDPIPGSMKRVKYAFNDTTKSDAPPPGTSYKPTPDDPSIWKRLGNFGKKVPGKMLGRALGDYFDGATTEKPWENDVPGDQFEADTYAKARAFKKQGYDEDEISKWVKEEIDAHRKRLQKEEERAANNSNARISLRRRKGQPCKLIRYGNLKCDGEDDQAHHVVADRAFRSVARPDASDLWNQDGYIKPMSMGAGLAICLNGNAGTKSTPHGIATDVYETKIARAQNGGMISLGSAEDAGAAGVEQATGGRCKKSDIERQLRNYHQALGMGADTWVRGQISPLNGSGSPALGSKAGGITSR